MNRFVDLNVKDHAELVPIDGGDSINEVIDQLNIPVFYYAFAALLGLGLWLWRKKWEESLLVAYCFLFFAMTVLGRQTTSAPSYNLNLLWSWRVWSKQSLKNLANIAVFIPIGALVGRLWKWKGLWRALGFSAFIEIVQLVSKRGLFECDDIIHNSLGALIGVCIYLVLTKMLIGRKR